MTWRYLVNLSSVLLYKCTHLDIFNNSLTGVIFVGEFLSLRYLDMSCNKIQGALDMNVFGTFTERVCHISVQCPRTFGPFLVPSMYSHVHEPHLIQSCEPKCSPKLLIWPSTSTMAQPAQFGVGGHFSEPNQRQYNRLSQPATRGNTSAGYKVSLLQRQQIQSRN